LFDSDKRHPIYNDYEWPPRVEVPFHRDAGRYGIWGSVDAVFMSPDAETYAIVDWKSGTQKQRSDFQLNFYRFGMANGIQKQEAWFHHLDRVRKDSIIQEAEPYPGDEEILEAIAQAETAKRGLVAGAMPEFNPDWYCNYCPVQDFCPADGDVRNQPKNRRKLERVLSFARPLTEPIE